jgi:cysteine synthase A
MKFNNVLESIGNTPHIRLSRLFPDHEVWIKDERRNPGGTIKDRIALAMVEEAERTGKLKKGSAIVEPTSGNTGIGLALTGAVKGYRVILVMPESMTIERRRVLYAYGAELILTPRELGMKGAIAKADEIVSSLPGAWMPMQFDNQVNPEIHAATTAQEILDDFPEGIDYLITGVGTGGHINGVGRVLKKSFPGVRVYAVEPADSPVLSGGGPGPHAIQGLGAGFIPNTYSAEVVDKVITIKGSEAFEMVRLTALKEGMMVGISSGAVIASVRNSLKEIKKGSRIITFTYDNGERYMSVDGLW